MRFAQIPIETFEQLQVEAGMVLTDFDPETGSFDNGDILCATTGGIKPDIKNDFKDFGEDIDNVKNNTWQLKRITNTTATLGFTPLNFNKGNLLYFLAAAEEDASGKIVCRDTLKPTDFKNIWFVGELSDGGMFAILMKNSLSTDGVSIQTKKNDKGTMTVTLTAHYDLTDQSGLAPVEFYISEGTEDTLSLSTLTLAMTEGDVAIVDVFATPDYDDVSITITGTGVTAELSTDKKHIIVTATDEGTPKITVEHGTLSVDCEVTVTAAESEG